MSDDPRDSQVAWAVAPVNAEGVSRMFFVAPDAAWPTMRNYISQDFNLANVGLPLQAVMTRCPTRQQGVAMLAKAGLVMAEDPAYSAKRADKVIWGIDKSMAIRETVVIMVMVPDMAREGMMLKGLVHSADLRQLGFPLSIEVSAQRTFADCMAYLQSKLEGEPLKDLTAADVSFPRAPGETTH